MSDEEWTSPEDEEWTPPTEAQMKVLAAKRERSDKISKLMGDYMLKGYRMLATCCPMCQCVELQDRQGAKYCVACQEVDCHETSKDNPALSQRAASGVCAEEAFITQRPASPVVTPVNSGSSASSATFSVIGSSSYPTPTSNMVSSTNPDIIPQDGAVPRVRHEQPTRQLETIVTETWSSTTGSMREECQHLLNTSLTTVMEKLTWANHLLRQETDDLVKATQLAVLVRELSATARSLTSNN